jgi:hypothetical protein
VKSTPPARRKNPKRQTQMRGDHAMLAFKVESWIWYSVVLLIAISRLYDSHIHMHHHHPAREPESKIPIATLYQAQKQKTDNPNAAFRAAWPLAPSVDTRPTNTS